jgi:hypothetical protein
LIAAESACFFAQSVFGCFFAVSTDNSAFIYVIKKKVVCDKKDDIQLVQQIICPIAPKSKLISLQIGWTTSMGTITRGMEKKVSATGWMDNIHRKNKKGQKTFLRQDGRR